MTSLPCTPDLEHMMHRPLLPLLAAFSLLMATACAPERRPATPTAAAAATRHLLRADIAVADEEEITLGPTLSGTLAAQRRAVLRAELGAPVATVAVRVGDAVRAGQVLATLRLPATGADARAARAAVRAAEVQLAQAQAERVRTAELFRIGGASRADDEAAALAVALAEASLDGARARLTSADTELDRTTVRAPFNGVLARRLVEPGDVTQPGDTLLEVVDPTVLELVASIPAAAAADVKLGQRMHLRVVGVAGDVQARIVRIAPQLDEATRQLRVQAEIPNARGIFKAGAFAEGRIAARHARQPTVPSAALEPAGAGFEVARVREGRVQRIAITPDFAGPGVDRVPVARGLARGDTVLVGSVRTLASGTSIRVED